MSVPSIGELEALDDHEYKVQLDRYLVERVEPCPPELAEALFSPALIDRTFFALLGKVENTAGQIAAASADLDRERAKLRRASISAAARQRALATLEEQEASRRAARTRHLTAVRVALARARRIREQLGRVESSYEVEDLRDAIRRHREAVATDPRPADNELHALVSTE